MQPSIPSNQFSVLLSVLVCLSLVGPAWADEEPKSASDDKPKPLTVSGVFEGVTSDEIVADTEHITSLEIKRIVPHATRVKKGQNVVWFETEEIGKQIKNAETDWRLSKLTLAEEEFNYQQFLETQTLDRKAAERARKHAQQDYDNFARTDRDRETLTAEFNLKSSEASLENALEELEQLEQMYKEDDLTEESEEIVLKRAKQAVEFAQFRLDGTKIQSDRSVNQSIPRSAAQHEDQLARTQLTYQKATADLNRAKQRRDIELARKRDKFKEEEDKLNELRAERRKTVLQAPLNGILLHGKLTRGKIGDKPSELKAGSTVTGDQVIATVVDPSKLRIRVDLEEKNLCTVVAGAKCKVTAKASPDYQINGTVQSVSAVPYAGTKYDCIVVFKKTKNQPAIMPTMTCDLEFAVKDGQQADKVDKKPADKKIEDKPQEKKPQEKKPGDKKWKNKPQEKKPSE